MVDVCLVDRDGFQFIIALIVTAYMMMLARDKETLYCTYTRSIVRIV